MSKMRFSAATALACSFLFMLPVQSTAKDAGFKKMSRALNKVAKRLSQKIEGNIVIMDFTPSGKENEVTSELGIAINDILTSSLSRRKRKGFRVSTRKDLATILRDSIYFGNRPDFADKLIKEVGMDVLISGTYISAGGKVVVYVKATSANKGAVLYSQKATFPKTATIKKMMVRRVPLSRKLRRNSKAPQENGDSVFLDVQTYYEGGNGRLYPLREGMVLTSEDNYSIYLNPDTESYVYVYQVDSRGKVLRLFPNPQFSSAHNPLTRRKHYWIPDKLENGKATHLYLDENKGQEVIYVLASKSQMPEFETIKDVDVDRFIKAIKQHEGRGEIRMMGVQGTRTSQVVSRVTAVQGNQMDFFGKRLSAVGGFYYKLQFFHH